MPMQPPPPDSEARRLDRLKELMVLDSDAEPAFDAIARLASATCGTPIALVTLVDETRQWFKANVGAPGVAQTPRDVAFCAHTILDDALLEVPDARCDDRFAAFPSVTGPHGVRFYAGAPLVMPGGERVGALCVLDTAVRQLNATQRAMLRSLADLVTQTLTMRRELVAKALSARSAYERVLANTADELADLYDNAPCGYHSLDADGRFVRVNKAALQWLGCSEEQVVGVASIAEFLTPEGLALFRDGFPRLMREGRLDDFEFDLVSRNGSVRRVVASATAIQDADGAFLTTRTVMFDVSELHRTRADLRRLATDQRAILDSSLVGIMKLRDRHIVWANRGAERMFGYADGELLGQPTRIFYADDARHAAVGGTGYAQLQQGTEFRIQLEALRKDGQTIWVDVSGKILDAAASEVLCMVTDITPLKRAEKNKARAAALEAENRHLTEIGKVKGVFLANMSHELRTPLNAVIGYTQLLQTGAITPDSPKFSRFLEQIGASGKQLLGLIDTVLDFAQADAGQLALSPRPVSPSTLLRNTVELFRGSAMRNLLAIAVEVDEDLGDVVVDELRISQVVAGFLSNAIKFSANGGYVMVRAWAPSAAVLRIEVEDTGIGIAQQDIPRLFSPFQQLSEGHGKAYPGAGLGLALSKKIAEAHGGQVGASSRVGVGSLFWIELPRQRALPSPGPRTLSALKD